jgi:23S rRNA (cytidine1920-2'-O)/16S rRNA (cytidine1409-2'-O)-methyltransferase
LPSSSRRSTSRRLDDAVADQADITRSQARSLILEGRVSVEGSPATKAGQSVAREARIAIEQPRRFVSRGGEKLDHALAAFAIEVRGAMALDVGASTGGFTDCLLQRGAASVTALDVGYGQRTNFRRLPNDAFPGGFDLIAIDASFISLRTILERAVQYLREGGTIVALAKPQFEAGRERLGAGGVVRERETHRAVLQELREAALRLGLVPVALSRSALRGPAGNREFFMLLRRTGEPFEDARIERVLDETPES